MLISISDNVIRSGAVRFLPMWIKLKCDNCSELLAFYCVMIERVGFCLRVMLINWIDVGFSVCLILFWIARVMVWILPMKIHVSDLFSWASGGARCEARLSEYEAPCFIR